MKSTVSEPVEMMRTRHTQEVEAPKKPPREFIVGQEEAVLSRLNDKK